MNELIKCLILEAGFPKFNKMYVVSDGAELEKFAELIVRECANYLENEYGKSVITGNDAADFIRKYFRVES